MKVSYSLIAAKYLAGEVVVCAGDDTAAIPGKEKEFQVKFFHQTAPWRWKLLIRPLCLCVAMGGVPKPFSSHIQSPT